MDSADEGMELEEITVKDLANMLATGLAGLQEIVEAQVGDKTLVDTLSPAVDSLKESAEAGTDFPEALEKMKAAAKRVWNPQKIWLPNLDVPVVLVRDPEVF